MVILGGWLSDVNVIDEVLGSGIILLFPAASVYAPAGTLIEHSPLSVAVKVALYEVVLSTVKLLSVPFVNTISPSVKLVVASEDMKATVKTV